MNVIYKYLIVFIIGFLLGCTVTCSALEDETPIEIIVPEEKGEFNITPKEKEVVYRDSIIYKDKLIYIDRPVDENRIKEFEYADEDEKGELYIECIKEREYEDIVEDENVMISYWAKTTGTLDDFKIDYTVKEKTIIHPSKKNTFYYGGELITNTESLEKINFKGSLLLENKSSKIYSLGYDMNKNIYLGVYFSF